MGPPVHTPADGSVVVDAGAGPDVRLVERPVRVVVGRREDVGPVDVDDLRELFEAAEDGVVDLVGPDLDEAGRQASDEPLDRAQPDDGALVQVRLGHVLVAGHDAARLTHEPGGHPQPPGGTRAGGDADELVGDLLAGEAPGPRRPLRRVGPALRVAQAPRAVADPGRVEFLAADPQQLPRRLVEGLEGPVGADVDDALAEPTEDRLEVADPLPRVVPGPGLTHPDPSSDSIRATLAFLCSSASVTPGRWSALMTMLTRGATVATWSTQRPITAITSSHSPSTLVNIAFVSVRRPLARTMATHSATTSPTDSPAPNGVMLNAAITVPEPPVVPPASRRGRGGPTTVRTRTSGSDQVARRVRAVLWLGVLLTGLLAGTATAASSWGPAADAQGPAQAQGAARTVATTQVRGAITPVIADHLADTVGRAAADGHRALVVLLDTPGGLVSSMREIVQTFLNAPLPVVVYVSPSGADAGSAGTFITLSAHVAAMAPATTIGAATPVDLEGGEVGDKIVNNAAAYAEAIAEARGRDVEFAVDSVRDGRSVTAGEALEVGAIDLVATDLTTLLEEIDGTAVTVGDVEVELATAGARVVDLEMTGVRRLLQRIADPNLAFIFISIGTLAIVYEIANPGMGAGGVLGAILLILAFFSLSVLPVNLAGVLLLVLAMGLFVVELFAPGVGVGAFGGTVALVLGGLFLFQRPTGLGVDVTVIVPTVVLLFVLTILAGRIVARSADRPLVGPNDDLVGRTGVVLGVAEGHPRIRLDGTAWRVTPADGTTIVDGTEVTVVSRDNLDLTVEPTSGQPDQHDT
jgi:membrane-bound serine protease (ClpP class)